MDFGMKLRRAPSAKTKTARLSSSQGSKNKMITTRKRSASKCRKCVCMPQLIGPVEFPSVWTEFRVNNQLCDGTITCEDGTEFKVHRAILSAVSPYFKALFTNSINRNQPETTIANLKAPSYIVQSLLDFAYTGICRIATDNVENMLRYADQFEVLGVVQLCCQFVLEHLTPRNCLGILNFARHYFCKDLEQKGRLFVRHNFTKLIKENLEFLSLDVEDVIDILQDDELNVKNEEIVFYAVQKWIESDIAHRKIYLLQLLKCIRLGTLSVDFIKNMLKWELVQNDQDCVKFLEPVINLIENPNQELDIVQHPLLRPRIPYDILFAIGGWSAGSPTNFIETYDTRADRWLLSTDTDSGPRAYHGLCALKGLIYMIGGFDGNEHFNTVRCFDPVTHTWKECACMYYPRCYVSVVMHDGKIYAMGGYNGRIRMNSAERYDPETNQWEIIQPMQRQRSDASAAALDDKIYIVGGFNGQEVMSSAEVYDTLSNQWSFIPHMLSARSGVSLIAFKNALYALGGFNGFTRLTTGEKYLPGDSSGWVGIAEMFSPRSNFATVILDDLIFVIGGFNGSTTINFVECYDPENNEWFDAAPMNLNRSALSACVISGLPNAKEYSLVGRSQRELGQGAGLHMEAGI
ncbi:kelch-like protein 10 isoform X2 [Onthophagus taurus]|uniref:kelch-like protein 10 isoform X2 n=1 Tax=Onthophagus taurus TaxID=166361 RepID=UPI000C209585|nr:kelch-like protein 10 isoform X2 [Onthophagus taurus]